MRPTLALRISTRASSSGFAFPRCVSLISVPSAATDCTYARSPRALTYLSTTPPDLQPLSLLVLGPGRTGLQAHVRFLGGGVFLGGRAHAAFWALLYGLLPTRHGASLRSKQTKSPAHGA